VASNRIIALAEKGHTGAIETRPVPSEIATAVAAGPIIIMAVTEADARHMARRLAKEEGILAGTSSGLNVVAAIRLSVELGPKASVVTLVCDSGLKYLAGDLFELA